MADSQPTEGEVSEGEGSDGKGTEGRGSEHRQTRRVVLGVAATLGMLAPAAPALAAGLGARSAVRASPGHAEAAGPGTAAGNAEAGRAEPDPTAPDGTAADSTAADSEVWGSSASGRGAGVRGNGRFGVVGEGTDSGVLGDGFVGVRGSTSIVDDDQRGVGVWAQAVAPGSTALRADGPSEFNGVTTFSRSGVTAVRRGSASVTVTGVALTAGSAILATLQHREDGVYLHAVETDAAAAAFTIFLTASPGRDARIAWFAVG